MKDSYKVIDMDTHVNPSLDVLEKYVDPAFRPRLAELQPYYSVRQRSRPDGTRPRRPLPWHLFLTIGFREKCRVRSTPEPCPARARP